MQNEKTIKDLCCNKKFYDLFKLLVDNHRCGCSKELFERLEILDKFFLTYKYPKLDEFGYNIMAHEGESGSSHYYSFILDNYELFLKETDEELYSIYRNAEDLYRDQSGIMHLLSQEDHPLM